MQIPVKLGIMELNESLLVRVNFDLGTELSIKGNDNTTFVTSSLPNDRKFKNGDYLRLVRTAVNITLIRLADSLNMEQVITELNFLKAATDIEEFAGVLQNVATTPYTNQLAFFRRVNGLDSALFLATLLRNGLYPKEHFEIVANINSGLRNTGWFSGLEIGAGVVGQNYARGGDIVSAVLTSIATSGSTSRSFITIVVANTMTDNNYFVRAHFESQGNMDFDNDVCKDVFKPISHNTFIWGVEENYPSAQSLKVHIEVVKQKP